MAAHDCCCVVADWNRFACVCRHEDAVWQVSWAYPLFGTVLASCGYDKKVLVWRLENGKWDIIHEYVHDSPGTTNLTVITNGNLVSCEEILSIRWFALTSLFSFVVILLWYSSEQCCIQSIRLGTLNSCRWRRRRIHNTFVISRFVWSESVLKWRKYEDVHFIDNGSWTTKTIPNGHSVCQTNGHCYGCLFARFVWLYNSLEWWPCVGATRFSCRSMVSEAKRWPPGWPLEAVTIWSRFGGSFVRLGYFSEFPFGS